MKKEHIIIEHVYNAPVEKLWKALTDKSQMNEWYFNQLEAFEARPGFQTQFNVNNEGKDYLHIWKVVEVMPQKKISYEWRYGGYPGNSLLRFELFPEGNQTKLILNHKNLETFLGDKYPELSKENFEQGWAMFINSRLKNYVEKS